MTPAPPITSRTNPLIKRIKRLANKKDRQAEGVFFVEGLRSVATAIEQGADIERLLYAPELLTSDFGHQLVTKSGHEVVPLSADLFAHLSERDHPTGLAALVRFPQQNFANWHASSQAIYVALDEISDPGNLGTILRTADAVGARGVIVCGREGTDPFHPQAVKASMGAVFSVPLAMVEHSADVVAWARDQAVQLVATSAKAKHDYREATYSPPLLLLMGSEREGLSAELQAQCDVTISLPMRGVSSSLNLAVATGVLLYALASPHLQSR